MGIEEFLLDQAWKQGYKEGFEIGLKEIDEEMALKMKKHCIDIGLISHVTGLSIEEIEKLS